MGVWMGPRGANADKKAPVFECTGTLDTDYLYSEETVNGVTRWELAVLKSCSFTFRRVGKVDITLIGAGENGGAGLYDYVGGVLTARGGAGGAGGKILRLTEQTLSRGTELAAVIGTTGGAATTFNGKSSANGASLAAGGDGAEVKYNTGTPKSGDNGDPGAAAFTGSVASRLFPTTKFAPGGGGGSAYNQGTSRGAGSGGADGGGNGGTEGTSTKNGAAGAANRGAGGGGGHGSSRDGGSGSGAAGGSGILLIRGSITA